MTAPTDFPSLASLEFLPYLTDNGDISGDLAGKIGLYAIGDREQSVQFIGYSRDIALSLKQHLVRCPQECYWVKVYCIDRPSRTLLETIRRAWIAENDSIPPGNGPAEAQWTQAIDAKLAMTPEDWHAYQKAEERDQIKLLKNAARRLETEIQQKLQERGVKTEIRFNPKLKEQGLLDLK
ncbi:MAG: GIY-YIG nuclease family protein [Chloroflexaceae bacterium]|nr:GIY-YIG nuclease family protein [Chloroflexaceae bacterium]